MNRVSVLRSLLLVLALTLFAACGGGSGSGSSSNSTPPLSADNLNLIFVANQI